MAAVVQSGVVPIMAAIANQIASTVPNTLGTVNAVTGAVLPIGLNQVLWTAKDTIPHFTGEHDVVLRMGSFISIKAEWSASGICQEISRYLIAYPRSRQQTDAADKDSGWLFTYTSGFAYWEEAVLASIWGYFPASNWNTNPIKGADGVTNMSPTIYSGSDSTTGDLLTINEIQASGGTDPVKGAMDLGWGESALTFEVNYLFRLMKASIP